MLPAAILLAAGRSAQPVEACLWMNAATAEGIMGNTLGGTVTMVAAQENGYGSCAFQRPGAELRIEVLPTEGAGHFARLAAACGSKTVPLKAIGNEAVVCLAGASAERTARAIGRVRDRIFTITLRRSDVSLTQERLREEARASAEQVAGNLF
jgi:hypothetical protein